MGIHKSISFQGVGPLHATQAVKPRPSMAPASVAPASIALASVAPAHLDWNHIRTLVAVAQTGSYTNAAAVLNTTQPTIGRHIAALEEALSLSLFDRNANGMRLTSCGQDILDYASRMADLSSQMMWCAQTHSSVQEGEVTLAASDLVIGSFLTTFMDTISTDEEMTGISIALTCQSEAQSFQGEGIALRHKLPQEEDLIARKATDLEFGLYRAADAMPPNPGPEGRTSENLTVYTMGVPEDSLGPVGFSLAQANPHAELTFKTLGVHADMQMVKTGRGYAFMPRQIGDLEESLVRAEESLGLDPSTLAQSVPLFLVSSRDQLKVKRVRVVFDALVEFYARMAVTS